MKKIFLCLLIPLILSVSGCEENTKYEPKELDPNVTYENVYLIMGQSNASGVSQHKYLETSHPDIYAKYTVGNPDVLISFDTDERIQETYVPVKFGYGNSEPYFGPEIGIAESLNEPSYIIKATYSGSCLMTQYVNSGGKKLDFYKRFIPFIKKQLKVLEAQGKHPRLRGMFWMQGESDSFLQDSYKYLSAQQHFYEYLRSDLNDWIYEYFNFVDAYISTRTTWRQPEIINDCKQQFADKNEHCYCIKTNGEDESAITLYIKSETFEDEDIAHYDSNSMLLLGQTAATYLIK